MNKQPNTQRSFRNALGAFATGVTIATTTDTDGKPIGVTASSFNSVSVDPPLVLWSLAKSSLSRNAFCKSGHFAVHVLTDTQEELSNRFARSGKDKFDCVEWVSGQLGSPLLCDYAALFECRTRHQYEGGDHVILVGEVVGFEARDEAPLLFHGGRYAERRMRPSETSSPSVDIEHGRFSSDFLFYLISRAHFQTSDPVRRKLTEMGLTMDEYMTLAQLSMEAPLNRQALASRLAHTGHIPSTELLDAMTLKGYIVAAPDGYAIAENGRNHFVETLAFGKALEADLANHFTPAELVEAKRFLQRIIELTEGAVPKVNQ